MVVVILCGGVGSRLWPISRDNYPKQFLRLPNGYSFLQKSFLLASEMEYIVEIIIVTNKELFFLVKSEIDNVNHKNIPITYILEPCVRSTAAAIASAAIVAPPSKAMLVLAADHMIVDRLSFSSAVSNGTTFAAEGNIVVFGMAPQSPETGYGYIKADGNNVLAFTEKPSLEAAKEYIKTECYYWNSGMFLFSVETIIEELSIYAPQTLEGVKKAIKPSNINKQNNCKTVCLDEQEFGQLPTISIDYAVMEKTVKMKVLPCNIGWYDIGSWDSYSKLFIADENNNRLIGETIIRDVSNCHIQTSEGRLTAALGVENLFIVDTADALLVADKSRQQDVKQIYNDLKSMGRSEHQIHRTCYRPWGHFTLLQTGDRYKIKHIVVLPGGSLSLQLHFHRSEHWVIVKGTAKVLNEDREIILSINESVFIKAGHKHRVENPGHINLEMIEVQCGDYLGEDDIQRFEDKYGRV